MKPATRKQYGAFNYSEAGAPDRFSDFEDAFRGGASEFNVGSVYETAPARGGVRAGDTGILAAKQVGGQGVGPVQQFMGVLRATLAPSGVTPGQSYVGPASTNAWGGDTPLDLQAQIKRPAPWRKGVA